MRRERAQLRGEPCIADRQVEETRPRHFDARKHSLSAAKLLRHALRRVARFQPNLLRNLQSIVALVVAKLRIRRRDDAHKREIFAGECRFERALDCFCQSHLMSFRGFCLWATYYTIFSRLVRCTLGCLACDVAMPPSALRAM